MEGNAQLAIIIPMLKQVAAGIRDDQLAEATPCALFTVAGVLGHMTDLASGFAPMFRGEPPAGGDGVPPSSHGDPQHQFDQAMDELLEAVQSAGALDRAMQTPAGDMPGSTFARLVAFDGLVHGWDLATSTQQSWQPPPDLVTEVDAFARQAITPEMRDGVAFAPEQVAPTGADAMVRLVAFTGRSA